MPRSRFLPDLGSKTVIDRGFKMSRSPASFISSSAALIAPFAIYSESRCWEQNHFESISDVTRLLAVLALLDKLLQPVHFCLVAFAGAWPVIRRYGEPVEHITCPMPSTLIGAFFPSGPTPAAIVTSVTMLDSRSTPLGSAAIAPATAIPKKNPIKYFMVFSRVIR